MILSVSSNQNVSVILYLLKEHHAVSWCLCCWTWNPIARQYEAQASELGAYSIFLWIQRVGESSYCFPCSFPF